MNRPHPLSVTSLLTLDLIRRLLREGIIVRSLVFPIGLVAGAMLATVVGVVFLRPPGVLALPHAPPMPAIEQHAETEGWVIRRTDDPRAMVSTGEARLGTDGTTLFMYSESSDAVALEAKLRDALDASWVPYSTIQATAPKRSRNSAKHLVQFIGGLFALYGVVFGCGSVARDRDNGTLEAELSLATPRWVHGLARWVASTLVLTAFYAFAVLLFRALLNVPNPSKLMLHGLAACGASTGIGLMVVGRAGLEKGFAGPISVGLTAVFTLLSLGAGASDLMGWLPIASLVGQKASGAAAVVTMVAFGLGSVALFTWRSARS